MTETEGPQGIYKGMQGTIFSSPQQVRRTTDIGTNERKKISLSLNQTAVSYLPQGGVSCVAYIPTVSEKTIQEVINVWQEDIKNNAAKNIKIKPHGDGFIVCL